MPKLVLLVYALCMSVAAFGQVESQELLYSTQKLQLSVTMDRTEYLPGEAAEITFAVSNPGAAIVVPTPFSWKTGCVYRSWKVGDEFRDPPETLCRSVVIDGTSTTTFAPGERREKVLKSYDHLFESGVEVLDTGGGVSDPGTYRLVYHWAGSAAMAEYTVVSPKLEAKAQARLHDILYTSHPGQLPPERLAEYVRVLALRYGNESYICVALSPVSHPSMMFLNADGSFNPVGAMPLKRIATSRAPVVSLSATADVNENLTIEFTDANGGRQTLYYPASYPARGECRAPKCFPGGPAPVR